LKDLFAVKKKKNFQGIKVPSFGIKAKICMFSFKFFDPQLFKNDQ